MKHLAIAAFTIASITACTSATRADLPATEVPTPPALKPTQKGTTKPAMPSTQSDVTALMATSWRVVTILTQAAPQSPAATMTFNAENRVSGNTGCNRYGANYRLTDKTLRISQGMSTKMACASPQMELEQDFNRALAETRYFSVDANGQLTLSSEAETLIVAVPMDAPQ